MPASLAAMLKDFIRNRASGFAFQTKSGRPLTPRNILRDSLRKICETATFHSFRRFRITNLREVGVSEDLVRFWVSFPADDCISPGIVRLHQLVVLWQNAIRHRLDGLTREGDWLMVLREDKVEIGNSRGQCIPPDSLIPSGRYGRGTPEEGRCPF